jgi:prepilin-type N-terminal cleavage/methylation domain-containing protein
MKRIYARQRGMTLIEVLAALAISAVLLVGLASLVDRSLDDMKVQQTANYQAQVVDAARRYLDANYDDVVAHTPAASDVFAISLAQLRTGKFLPSGFADTNAYQQGTCLLVRRPDPTNYPRQIDALIVTTGDQKIGDKDLPAVAIQAGSGGGHIVTATPGIARGASWQMQTTAFQGATCPGSTKAALQGNEADVGHLVSSLFYDGAAQQKADFLYRGHLDGHPELNTMRTPLLFAKAAIVQGGTSCKTPEGKNEPALAIDLTTRAILTCGLDAKWSLPPSWKDPVLAYDDLPTDSLTKLGDVRMVKGLGRAFTYVGGGVWQALAVDQDGNMKVPETLTAKTLEALVKVDSKGKIHADDHISTNLDLHIGQDLFVERNAKITGKVEIAGDVTVDRAVTAEGIVANMWMSAPAVELKSGLAYHGQACDYWEYSSYSKQLEHIYPPGTIVPDRHNRLMICGTGKVFIYVDEKEDDTK